MYFINRDIRNGPPYIVAEIGGNNNYENYPELLLNTIEEAHKAGADAVKLQVYTQDEMVYANLDQKYNKLLRGNWAGQNLTDIYSKCALPRDLVQEAFKFAREKNIPLFASVFGYDSLAFLEGLYCPAYKISSYEANDKYFIEGVIGAKKPVLISTGTLSWDEIIKLAEYTYKYKDQTTILHCVSAYPCEIANANLETLLKLQNLFGLTRVIGYSDHTIGCITAEYATILGARIIEKHFALTNDHIDGAFNSNIDSFKRLVAQTKLAYSARYAYKSPNELHEVKRSLWVIEDIKQGEIFTLKNIKSLRPDVGLSPNEITNIIGKKATKDIKAGEPLTGDKINGYGI